MGKDRMGKGFFLEISKKLSELGHEVETLSRTNYNNEKNKIKHHQVDLSQKIDDTRIFDGVDCIFHTAAKAGIDGKYNDYYAANFFATKNLLELAKTCGVQFFK